ncbi:hypothetical protein DID80_02455 [Candidatus Marinamargulisbacteria bacterium SCGC AAA071-K20]|nr:hypothetical protein DID80_02455 [Candidatus Marinamargulisbacteria bacterium SCGC AAA071-K20]
MLLEKLLIFVFVFISGTVFSGSSKASFLLEKTRLKAPELFFVVLFRKEFRFDPGSNLVLNTTSPPLNGKDVFLIYIIPTYFNK